MMLSDVCLSVAYIGLSREQRGLGRPKFGTEVAYVTRDSDTTFKVKRSKVKVTRPLCSPPCWRARRLQRWAWERLGRGKLLLRCRLLGGARRFGAHGGGEGRGHIVAAARLQLVYINSSFIDIPLIHGITIPEACSIRMGDDAAAAAAGD